MALDFCNKLIKNCKYLESQLQYRIDFKSNFIEVLFAASDGEHYLNIEFEKFQIWELAASGYGGPDWIREVIDTDNIKGETAFYTFDRIEFVGNQETLQDFYQNIYECDYENEIKIAFKRPKGNSVIINVNGIYTANTESHVGDKETRIPQRIEHFDLLSEIEAIDKSGIETILFEKRGFFVQEFFLDEIGNIGSIVSKQNELEEVNIYYQNSKVRTYQWIDDSPGKVDVIRYGYWKCNNADWWENCINSKWVKFYEKKKNNG